VSDSASPSRALVIAIDGVVGAGKSTVARNVAAALGYRHLDTGAMYRAVALSANRQGITPSDTNPLQKLLDGMRLDLEPEGQGGRIRLDGEDVSDAIRSPDVSRVVGSYADIPAVRRALVQQQQAMGATGGIVAEGRDMTSVVFPQADLKVYMIADLDERTQRRYQEFVDKGVDISFEQVRSDIEQRDQEDAVRDYGGDDASDFVEVDTSGLSADEVSAQIIFLAQQRGA
jgi:cytidylate kinase